MPDLFGTDSVRLDILKYIKGLYEAATDQDPPASGKKYYGLKFSIVEIGPLGDPDARKRSAIGIVAGPERKSDLFPLKTSMFEVAVEFRITVNRDDDQPGILAERMLGVVQQIVYDDDTLGGKVIKVDETGNEVDLMTYADRTVEGVVRFNVHYRHTFANVFDTTPTV